MRGHPRACSSSISFSVSIYILSLSPVAASFLSLVSTWMSLWLLLSKANSGAGLRSACQTFRFPRWEYHCTLSAFLIVLGFFSPSLSNGRRFSFFFYGQIYWHEHLLWGSTGPRGLVSEWKTSLSLSVYLQYNHSPFGLCVNEDDFISSGKFDPILRNASADGTSERYNWVNELHALICCSFIRAARGVTTISLLHRLLYVWWVPWRENLIMQSNFLKANCFDSWKQGRRGLSSAFLFFFPFCGSCSLLLQWIFKYYCDLFITAQCSASQSYFQVDIFTGRREERHINLYMGRCLRLTWWQRWRACESIFLLLFEGFCDIF